MQPSSDTPHRARSRQLRRYGPLVGDRRGDRGRRGGACCSRWRRRQGEQTNDRTPAREGAEGRDHLLAGQGAGPRRRVLEDVRPRRPAASPCRTSSGPSAMRTWRTTAAPPPGCHRATRSRWSCTSAQEHDPIIDYITAAIKNDDTTAQAKETYRATTAIFERPVPDLRAQGPDRVRPGHGHHRR